MIKLIFKKKLVTTKVFLGLLFLISGCRLEPKVKELSSGSDPEIEIERIDQDLKQAKMNQVDILSPKNYDLAVQSRNKAVNERSSSAEQKTILHSISLAQTYLENAQTVSEVSGKILKAALKARTEAITALAQVYYPKELAALDQTFKNKSEKIENNNTYQKESEIRSLENQYLDIELLSIKMNLLGSAQALIQQAVNEGAPQLTPVTLSWAQKQMAQDVVVITSNRHNQELIKKASLNATLTSKRLIKMVRSAKNSTAKNPEERAQQLEKNDLAINSSENELDQAQSDLQKAENQLDRSKNSNQLLQSEIWLDKEFESARNLFTAEEAEVYKQGYKLLLRLKGLSFPNNKSQIISENFNLLAKVQKVIADLSITQVSVEGHTDSIGTQKLNEVLSMQRAQSVQNYLVANKNVGADKITAEGFGDSKPIATNKTALGRSQNRRVDIIISAEHVSVQ